MPGPAPKPAAQRRNRNEKQAGEWKELTPHEVTPPDLPDDREWSARTARAWSAWWSDPVSQEWSASDRDLVEHMAEVYETFQSEGTAALASEVRQLREHLGLTPKGRQGRRWKIAEPAEVVDLPKGSASDRMEKLRATRTG